MKYTKNTYQCISKSINMGLLTAIICLCITVSCKRDELCYMHFDKAMVRVLVRYNVNVSTDVETVSDPNIVYLGIYNADDGKLIRKELIDNINAPQNIELGVGRYMFVVYNEPYINGETVSANSVYYSREDHWETFSVSAQSYTASNSKSEVSTVWVEDVVMSGRITLFEITKEMISRAHIHPVHRENIETGIVTIDTTLYFYPKMVFPEINITLRVKNYSGWTFRRTNGNRPYIDGVASHYSLGVESYSDVPSKMYLDFKNGNPAVNGVTTFTSSSYMIGFLGGESPDQGPQNNYTLFLRFDCLTQSGVESNPMFINLRTGEGVRSLAHHYTAAGMVRPSTGERYSYDIWDIEVGVELEERIPMGDGLDADLEDWDDENVPLNSPPQIYFNPNGASEGVSFAWTYAAGTKVNLPNCPFTPPANRSFAGWNILPDGTGDNYWSAEQFTIPKGGTTLYAIWQ